LHGESFEEARLGFGVEHGDPTCTAAPRGDRWMIVSSTTSSELRERSQAAIETPPDDVPRWRSL
jgi:hypothetical protein